MDFELRKWEKSDAESFFKYSSNPKILEDMRDAFPSTLEDCRKTVENFSYNDESKQCCRAIIVNGEAVGSIALFIKNDVYCRSAEIAYWLGEPFWGRGIMSEAIKQLCQTAFNNMILYGYLQSLMHIILVQEKPLKKLDLFWRA